MESRIADYKLKMDNQIKELHEALNAEKREATEGTLRAERRMQEEKLHDLDMLERCKREKQEIEDRAFDDQQKVRHLEEVNSDLQARIHQLNADKGILETKVREMDRMEVELDRNKQATDDVRKMRE